MPCFSSSPHTQSKRPSSSGWRKTSVWNVRRTPSMPFCFFQSASASRAAGASGSKRPMMQKRSGWLLAASMARSLRSPSQDGGTMMTPSTPALSISAKSSSLPSGARCGSARAGQGRSGVLAPQTWTCASTIFIGSSLAPAQRGAQQPCNQPHAEAPQRVDQRHHDKARQAEATAHRQALDREHDEPVRERDDDGGEHDPAQHAVEKTRQPRHQEGGGNAPQPAPKGQRQDGRHAPGRHRPQAVERGTRIAELVGDPEAELVEDQHAQRAGNEADEDGADTRVHGALPPGGRRSRHGAARSSSAASENSISSAPKRPTKCMPIGRPSSVQASGTDIAGTPVALHTAVNGIIGARPCWYCSSVPSILTVPSGKCVRAMVGDSSTSCCSKNWPSWRPVRWKVCTARMYSWALMPCPISA